ncbi:hypothetical protein BDV96DRAFT_599532 [Lophiotrema nucula]|uniref:Uncharacterized protein n=1 Tax=Lophiotrema nucula TaxID=690887 RepID=A0A6A5ZA93_9PLEO|nr:hypothetical protein BDV96DRAFT_599532 [Lophiotrema nucula]
MHSLVDSDLRRSGFSDVISSPQAGLAPHHAAIRLADSASLTALQLSPLSLRPRNLAPPPSGFHYPQRRSTSMINRGLAYKLFNGCRWEAREMCNNSDVVEMKKSICRNVIIYGYCKLENTCPYILDEAQSKQKKSLRKRSNVDQTPNFATIGRSGGRVETPPTSEQVPCLEIREGDDLDIEYRTSFCTCSKPTTITKDTNGELRFRVDASAPLNLEFSGDTEDIISNVPSEIAKTASWAPNSKINIRQEAATPVIEWSSTPGARSPEFKPRRRSSAPWVIKMK